MFRRLASLALTVWAFASDALDSVWDSAASTWPKAFFGVNPATDRGQVGTVIQVGVIGLSIIVMILVYGEVYDSLPINAGTDYANQTTLENASGNATQTFSSAMELAPVIMIILLAGVVIAVVQRFRA